VALDGVLLLWDLNENKHKRLIKFQAMKKAKPLHVTFNSVDPFLLVGDDRGGVYFFKIPNALCKGPLKYEPPKDEQDDKGGEGKVVPTTQELEMEKMERFLDSLDKQVY